MRRPRHRVICVQPLVLCDGGEAATRRVQLPLLTGQQDLTSVSAPWVSQKRTPSSSFRRRSST